MRKALLPFVALLGATLAAQATSPAPQNPTPAAPAADELASSKAKLGMALQKATSLHDTAFTVAWGPDAKKKKDDAFARAFGDTSHGKAKGSWHDDRLHVTFDNDQNDAVVVAGRRTIAKDDNNDWKLRGKRYADGNTLDFVPDPAVLLQLLATWDLAVTHREVGALDDRPVEIVTVALSNDQVAEAIWTGAMPEALTMAMSGNVFRLAAGMRAGGRAAAQAPDTQIDLAIHLDPATGTVHLLHCRGWTKENARGGMGVVVMRAGGAAKAVDEEEEEEADEAAEEKAKNAPLVYKNGLPERSRKKTSVCDYTVRFLGHGKTAAPELTNGQKKLLGH